MLLRRGTSVMAKGDVGPTVAALAGYGTRATGSVLPTPFLPVRLGGTTGSDATLFVGGWSYLAMPGESTGDKVAKGVAIGLFVVIAIAIIVLLEKDGHHGGDHHHGGGDSPAGGCTVAHHPDPPLP